MNYQKKINRWSFFQRLILVILFVYVTSTTALTGIFSQEKNNNKSGVSEKIVTSSISIFNKVKSFFKQIQNYISNNISNFNKENNLGWQIILAFLAGLSVSLTPCIYPMIPVTAAILTSKKERSLKDLLRRVFAYFSGLLSVFSLLGVIAVKFNLIFGSWLASPYVLLLLSSVFIFLGLSLLDIVAFDLFFAINIPEITSVFSVFLAGAAAALMASPCMTPALLSLLTFVATTNNLFLGAAMFFSFGLGMNLLVLLIALFGSSLQFLPKPGQWMDEVRKLLGFGIFFLAITTISPLFKSNWPILLMKGCLALCVSIYYYVSIKNDLVQHMIEKQLSENPNQEKNYLNSRSSLKMIFKKTVSILALLIACYFFLYSYLGKNNLKLIQLIKKILF